MQEINIENYLKKKKIKRKNIEKKHIPQYVSRKKTKIKRISKKLSRGKKVSI